MSLRRKQHRLMLIITLFLFSISLACVCLPGSGGATAPTPPGGAVKISSEAAERLKTRLNDSVQQNTNGEIILRFDNEEISSYLALELQKQGGQAILQDPQIWFTSGKIFITGTLKGVMPIDVPARITATALAKNKKVEFSIENATMGPLPFPQNLLDTFSQSVNETLYESIDPRAEVSRLEILEGEMVIVLRRPQQSQQSSTSPSQ